MNTEQIYRAIERHLGSYRNFIGVYLSDNLEWIKREKEPVVFIVNTLRMSDPATLMGHYIVLYYDKKRKFVYFIDSYNFDKQLYNTEINRFCTGLTVEYLPFRLQNFKSLVCGLYSIFFTVILTREGVRGIDQVVRLYFKRGKFKYNDAIVTKYCYKRFNLPPYHTVFK